MENDPSLAILAMGFAFCAFSQFFVPNIHKLKNECDHYVEWHGYDAPLYQRIKSRTGRAASSFCRVQRSNAKDMLAGSGSSNSTQSQTLREIIGGMDCVPQFVPFWFRDVREDLYKNPIFLMQNKFLKCGLLTYQCFNKIDHIFSNGTFLMKGFVGDERIK